MTRQEKFDYMGLIPLVDALWWFIENISPEDPDRTDLFFELRRRVRVYHDNPRTEQQFEKLYRATFGE